MTALFSGVSSTPALFRHANRGLAPSISPHRRTTPCTEISLLAGSIVLAFSAGAQAQTKWDLPSAYPASNFHVENLTNFVRTWIACRAAS